MQVQYVESEGSQTEDKQAGAQGNWASDNRFSIEKCGTAAKLLMLPGLAV